MSPRIAGVVATAALALSAPVASTGSVDRKWTGRSSQGRRVRVVLRPDRTIYVAMTVRLTCSGPESTPSYPQRPGGTIPRGPSVGYERQLLAFSATVGAGGGFSLAVRSGSRRVQAHGRVGHHVARGEAKVWQYGPNFFDCNVDVAFSAAPHPRKPPA